MAKKIKKHGKTALILGLILTLVAMYLAIPISQAAQITSRQMKISDSRPTAASTSVTYDFQGTTSTDTVKCLRMRICNESDITGSCTKPTGLSTTGAAKGDAGDWNVWDQTHWTGTFTTDGDVKYTYSTGEIGGTNASFSTDSITNPTSAGVYYAWINTYSDEACSTAVDSGVTAFYIIAGVTVSATVAETLSVTISDSAIGFGTLDSSEIRYATANEAGATSEPGDDAPTYIQVSTNAASGMGITIKDDGDGSSTAGLYESSTTELIPAVASSDVSVGSEEYGVYGKGAGSGITIDEGFDNDTTNDLAISRIPQTFATASGPLDAKNVDISAKASIAGDTPAGSYSDTLTLITTPTY